MNSRVIQLIIEAGAPIINKILDLIGRSLEDDSKPARKTAGEIAAEAEARAQEDREQKFDKADAEKKLEDLKRGFGPRRNTWL